MLVEQPLAHQARMLQEAIAGERAVRISYRSRGQAEASPRVVVPRALRPRGERWQLEAYAPEHDQVRTYRLEAVESVTVLEEDAPRAAAPAARDRSEEEGPHALVWIAAERDDLRAALGARVLWEQEVRPEDGAARPGWVARIRLHDQRRLRRMMLHEGGALALWPQ